MQRDFRSFGETPDAKALVVMLLTSYFSTSYTSFRIDDEDLESLAHGPEALAGGLSHHHGPYGLRSHRYLQWFDDLRLDVLQSHVADGLDDQDAPPDVPDGAPSEDACWALQSKCSGGGALCVPMK